jgi:hypothetical protein
MKTILVMLILGSIAYYSYTHFQGGEGDQAPKEITNPVYLDTRLEMSVQGRQFEFALFGKMANEDECRNRADVSWGKMLEGCAACVKTTSSCQASLEPRYLRLFDDAPINTTYLSLTRGKPTERDGRIVFWGVTAEEGSIVCDIVKKEFTKNYSGAASCVLGSAQ